MKFPLLCIVKLFQCCLCRQFVTFHVFLCFISFFKRTLLSNKKLFLPQPVINFVSFFVSVFQSSSGSCHRSLMRITTRPTRSSSRCPFLSSTRSLLTCLFLAKSADSRDVRSDFSFERRIQLSLQLSTNSKLPRKYFVTTFCCKCRVKLKQSQNSSKTMQSV